MNRELGPVDQHKHKSKDVLGRYKCDAAYLCSPFELDGVELLQSGEPVRILSIEPKRL